MPEMPAVDVDAAVQAQVALRGVFCVAGAPVVGVELVAEQADRHAGAPLVGADIAAHRAAQRGLGHAQVQSLLAEVETGQGACHDLVQPVAATVGRQLQGGLGRQAREVDAHLLQQCFVQAGQRVLRAGLGLELHFAAANPVAVDVDVWVVVACRDHVGARVARDVNGLPAGVQKAGVEVDGSRRGLPLAGGRGGRDFLDLLALLGLGLPADQHGEQQRMAGLQLEISGRALASPRHCSLSLPCMPAFDSLF